MSFLSPGVSKKTLPPYCEVLNLVIYFYVAAKNGATIVAKWTSLMDHITNSHTNFADPLCTECAHGPLAQNYEWIEPGELNVLKCLNYVVIVRAMFVKVLI